MTTPDDPGSPTSGEPTGTTHVHQSAEVSGHGTVYQAGRDMTFVVGEHDIRRAATGDDRCAYPGMAAFTTAQSRWFHGRQALVNRMLDKLADLARTGGLLMVVAPSGAGKSSLLSAGLVPALTEGRLNGSRTWPLLRCTPTAHPIAELTGRLAASWASRRPR